MTDDADKELPKQQQQGKAPVCPNCGTLPRLTHRFLDTRNEKTVRLYQCDDCGKRVWDD